MSLPIKDFNRQMQNQNNSVDNFQEQNVLKITKKLNPLAYIVLGSLYTVAIVFSTIFFIDHGKDKKKAHLNEQRVKKEILEEIKKLNSAAMFNNSDGDRKNLDSQFEKLRSNLIDEINRINIKYVEMIENNSTKKDRFIASLSKARPISEKIKNGEAIVYNEANGKILRFKHRKEYKRAKQMYSSKREEFLKKLDLSKAEDKEKLMDFDDEVDLALYEIKQNQYAIQKHFKEQKYLVVEK
jgi:ribosomal protein L24E